MLLSELGQSVSEADVCWSQSLDAAEPHFCREQAHAESARPLAFQFIVNLMQCFHPSRAEVSVRGESQRATTAIGVFLFFGAVMASLAGTTLIWRGTLLDHMWVLNAPAYKQLAPFGTTVGVPFLVLSTLLAVAGGGWFGRRPWGWRLAVVIIAMQTLGDLISIFMGHFVRGAAGVTIASALLIYLLRPGMSGAFVARGAIQR
jgi:hypothetical protein